MMKMRSAISAAALVASCAAGSAAAQDALTGAGPTIVLPPEFDETYVTPIDPSVAPIEYDPVLETPYRHEPARPYAAPYPQPYAQTYAAPYADPYRRSAAAVADPAYYERDEWLDNCRDTYLDHNGRDRDGVLSGLLGAAAGGLLGNRIADGERLAGTLIGAGVGGLAGLAIGAAIDAATRRDRLDDCEIYLDRYSRGYSPQPNAYYTAGVQPAYPAPFYGSSGQPMMLVPVMVPVHQRVIVREYVTEEYID